MPTIMVPFTEKGRPDFHDIFVYLRPETNGILVESILLKVIQENPLYKNKIKLVYLANLPGDFIVRKRIVQNHYKVKLYFTGKGKLSFTPYMRQIFEQHFRTDFDKARIIGSFAALEIFKMDYQQLFDIWVDRGDMVVINGQSIKKYHDYYIINYDLPAILHKNNTDTDIAVMMFRSELDYVDFYGMITRMEIALKREKILGDKVPVSRAFHYSKGPFEQMLDANGYLYDKAGSTLPLEDNSFYQYLLDKGLSDIQIKLSIEHPVMRFCIAENFELEDDIKIFTAGDTYREAYSKLIQATSQYIC
ncbi:MAG: hypothetical protein JW874_11485 [Spirochaetales bacterium]|nr:hypothetical protein [Spirochaetales bacterium]